MSGDSAVPGVKSGGEKYEAGVSTRPVKRFFVDMLTRDIAVEDAILDLLDNCIDGVTRNIDEDKATNVLPFDGFKAKITVNENLFEIEDNCGGIPWDLHDKAFRMGRPYEEDLGAAQLKTKASVGVYGIGMKRAIFKMGEEARIFTQSGGDRYEIPITSEWMRNESSWNLNVVDKRDEPSPLPTDGTRITVSKLDMGISERFSQDSYKDDLLEKIESHYAVIIGKGFRVEVNGIDASPKPVSLYFATNEVEGATVRPYVFTTESDGVSVFVTVGLRSSVPGEEDVLESQEVNQYSSDEAGWTVICNDRVVLYCNKDELTGWGTAGVPRYHTQFIAISGVVEFHGDPRKLPTTTTKRGLDFSSTLYQQVLDRMRDGIKIFTNFTNKWKSYESEAKTHVNPTPIVSFSELKTRAEDLKLNDVQRGLPGRQYKPKLPMPVREASDVRIAYHRDKLEVERLANQILDMSKVSQKEVRQLVGEKSFEFAYEHLVVNEDGKGSGG